MNNLNSAFENELYFEFLKDPESVTPEWRNYFERNFSGAVESLNKIENVILNDNGIHNNQIQQSEVKVLSQSYTPINNNISSQNVKLASYETLEVLPNIAAKIADNMEESLQIPTATSIRSIPVKAMDENRRIINKIQEQYKKPKVSFSHILLWAIVKALQKYPKMNASFERIDGKANRKHKDEINIGVASDVLRKDGMRLLMVPNVKNAGKLHFSEFLDKLDDLIGRAKNNKLTLDDLEGTTVSLTNPGMIGTNASIPRLMKGQGLIIASGSIDYPNEFMAVRPDLLSDMAISKVVTLTSTYDHRIIQGAESAEFLLYIHKLIIGEFQFYDQIFASLKVPFEPIRWQNDKASKSINTGNGISNFAERLEKSALVMQMIHAYRVRGHLLASINPLGLDGYSYPELDPAYYGLNIWDLEREFPSDSTWGADSMQLRSIIELLRESYCGSIGVEYMSIADISKKDWIKKKIEATRNRPKYSINEKTHILKKLIEADMFENFVHTKFVGHKRFSLEGSESIIVFLDKLFQDAADANMETLVLGMAHRGRLNVLVNCVGKKLEYIFNEFDGNLDPDAQGSGDVKYHLGEIGEYVSLNNNKVTVRLAPNPSHLEIVNPVILGMSRAISNTTNDTNYKKTMPVLIHGDAAFAGQGIAQETLNFMNLDCYKNGGTIHVVINNQIGFTTSPEFSRSTTYCTDVAKMMQVPILHVNGNDPEAVALAASFAIEYRNEFGNDVIIDLISYRKYGHNEGDEPSYTQPLLYKKIKSMTPVRELYENELIKTKQITSEQAKELHQDYSKVLNDAFDARTQVPKSTGYGLELNKKAINNVNTSISKENVELIINSVTNVPNGFQANPKVVGGLKKRLEMLTSALPTIDWATGEVLAFGGLLIDNHPVRLSGEDSRRGTFSHRHGVLIDFVSENTYTPLNHIKEEQAKICIYDSPLSELGVMGFDYGYSVIVTNGLTLWEAQFGDFANMAQPIIDQFVACGEIKWGQKSNLVLLLPHGQEGQGPEHSSARLERFLQLCAENNMIVANFTTPANYFHALRRQVLSQDQMPLIVMSPKSTLRHALAVSSVEDFSNGQFQHIIGEIDNINPANVTRLILSTGKVYYDLLQARRNEKIENVAMLRIEQLYPLHSDLLSQLINSYPNAKEIIWVQEEPKNQGAWNYILPELQEISNGKHKIYYSGRKAMAATATGSAKIHSIEQESLVSTALKGAF